MKKETASNKTEKRADKKTAGKSVTAAIPPSHHKPALARNTSLEATVTSLDSDGYGTARVDGLALKISGALPGDMVIAKVDHASFGNVAGHLHKLLHASPLRSKRPPCTSSAACLGCPLIAMRYTDQ